MLIFTKCKRYCYLNLNVTFHQIIIFVALNINLVCQSTALFIEYCYYIIPEYDFYTRKRISKYGTIAFYVNLLWKFVYNYKNVFRTIILLYSTLHTINAQLSDKVTFKFVIRNFAYCLNTRIEKITIQ